MTTVVVTGPATEVRLQVCGLLHLAESWWVSLTEYNPAGMLKRVENLLQHLWNQVSEPFYDVAATVCLLLGVEARVRPEGSENGCSGAEIVIGRRVKV